MMIHCQNNRQWSIVAFKVFLPLKIIHLHGSFSSLNDSFGREISTATSSQKRQILHFYSEPISESMWMTTLICFKYCLANYYIFPIYTLFTNDPHSQRGQLFFFLFILGRKRTCFSNEPSSLWNTRRKMATYRQGKNGPHPTAQIKMIRRQAFVIQLFNDIMWWFDIIF